MGRFGSSYLPELPGDGSPATWVGGVMRKVDRPMSRIDDQIPAQGRSPLDIAHRVFAQNFAKVSRVQAVTGPDGTNIHRSEHLAAFDVLHHEQGTAKDAERFLF